MKLFKKNKFDIGNILAAIPIVGFLTLTIYVFIRGC